MLKGIKEVYVIKDDNSKGTSYHTQLRQRNLNKEKAERKDNFVILEIGNNDYIVVNNKRYYLNFMNCIRCQNVAIFDIDELEKTKSYAFDQKYLTDNLNVSSDFDELRNIAKEQYDLRRALPQIQVTREWNPDKGIDGYKVNVMFNSKRKIEEL